MFFFYMRLKSFELIHPAKALRRSIDDFVIISYLAGKSNKVKIIEANLYERKMTSNDDVVFAIEKTLLSNSASLPYFRLLI